MTQGHILPEKVRKGDRKRERGNRTGFTTGANSAAAATAATLGLVEGRVPDSVVCLLPNARQVAFAITDGWTDGTVAHAVSVKDAGDDPDATHGAHLTADVRRLPGAAGKIVLKGGAGVGVLTRPGLGLEVGGPAINPVPRKNIMENVSAAGSRIFHAGDGLEVTISVPGGEEMAKKTLNTRLGILGGISILGTTGIVRPYSTAAFRASVVQAVDVAANQGQTTVVFTTGGRTEKCAMREFAQLDQACFVQMGDFVKAAFLAATRQRMRRIIVGAMVGKLTKIGQGLSVTHAWREEVDRDLIAEAAVTAGAPPDLVVEIRAAETARFAAERLSELGLSENFHRALALRAIRSLRTRYPGEHRLTVLACDFEGRPIAIVEEGE
ncbi:MAG: cobalt-precorrin-5B (C(1))-methyltransferase [Hydrogenophilales bacterium CG03_land_8_20_14_0_80_62_28]|nr:cobalt-precorrin-5B (C(1))-methyltransferase [Betaproteobacteria bacterium]OIO79332.1 MAG: cobalt-precorrin-5B (C(1))-methyltransferase [Hydrogenophilaceae bacterium CG1_02_62_390]PIV21549.1 MAG: cobalt-precorrin-5B (C(1))-methyltransferase [Hydrogenophilales bacterium CG03_land_8_20_14_0_80_62_28]PIW37681.1 MAG: cobalt-precorrin-5B (C(1))-methyltransferase [Hydrogenophilales bacterium CG15_BIG_FIL_POST_REV_8_21_14_020_62_31]PIW72920.1 MAG: cobalt-precorrin-5B (C(1))-methyltransferase [Hydro